MVRTSKKGGRERGWLKLEPRVRWVRDGGRTGKGWLYCFPRVSSRSELGREERSASDRVEDKLELLANVSLVRVSGRGGREIWEGVDISSVLRDGGKTEFREAGNAREISLAYVISMISLQQREVSDGGRPERTTSLSLTVSSLRVGGKKSWYTITDSMVRCVSDVGRFDTCT